MERKMDYQISALCSVQQDGIS